MSHEATGRMQQSHENRAVSAGAAGSFVLLFQFCSRIMIVISSAALAFLSTHVTPQEIETGATYATHRPSLCQCGWTRKKRKEDAFIIPQTYPTFCYRTTVYFLHMDSYGTLTKEERGRMVKGGGRWILYRGHCGMTRWHVWLNSRRPWWQD